MQGMPRPRLPYHHGDLRNALVSAAAQLVEQGGQEHFSLRETARSVGVTANAAYRHFADKSGLLTAVAASGFEELSRRMAAAMARRGRAVDDGATAPGRLRAVGRAYVELALERPELFRLMFSPSGLSCLDGGAAQIQGPTPAELLGRVLDGLVAEGQMSAQGRVGAELRAWAAVHGFALLVLDGRSGLQSKAQRADALADVLDFIIAGLCDQPPSTRQSSARRPRA
ncbi:MAG: TetR/AcrR family transcriptional regulator [Vicinamibacterales bacterium]